MSNFLFQNISNVFGAPAIVKEIVDKLTPAQEDPKKNKRDAIEHINEIPVDEDGNIDIPDAIVIGKAQGVFGDKVYEDMQEDIVPASDVLTGGNDRQIDHQVKQIVDSVKDTVKQHVIDPAAEAYELRAGARGRIERQIDREIDNTFQKLKDDYIQQTKIARVEYERAQKEAETPLMVKEAETRYEANIQDALKAFTNTVTEEVQRTIQEKPKELVETLERHKAEEEKRSVEDDVRAHLRGFARTIPSFIMAYGDDELTLANFDDYTEDDVFEEVIGISEADFRFLRDGGDYVDENTGLTEHFAGHLFDEVVFNDSIREFLKKKEQLADYFDESQDEDIFD